MGNGQGDQEDRGKELDREYLLQSVRNFEAGRITFQEMENIYETYYQRRAISLYQPNWFDRARDYIYHLIGINR